MHLAQSRQRRLYASTSASEHAKHFSSTPRGTGARLPP